MPGNADWTVSLEWTAYLLLFGAGLVAGALNVVAGGGSFLTLPVLIFLGLPAGVANGTNRVGILIQNIGAVWSFDRHGVLDRRAVLWAALPATAGAGVGAFVVQLVDDQAFQRILAFFMVALTLATLWSQSPGRSRKAAVAEGGEAGVRGRAARTVLAASFFAVGIYGGFVQAGVGFLILAATSATGLDLVRGNAVKVLTVLCFTVLSLLIFWWHGRVAWSAGLALGAGTLLGGLFGVRLTVLKGHRFVRAFVTVTVLAFAVRLWWTA